MLQAKIINAVINLKVVAAVAVEIVDQEPVALVAIVLNAHLVLTSPSNRKVLVQNRDRIRRVLLVQKALLLRNVLNTNTENVARMAMATTNLV